MKIGIPSIGGGEGGKEITSFNTTGKGSKTLSISQPEPWPKGPTKEPRRINDYLHGNDPTCCGDSTWHYETDQPPSSNLEALAAVYLQHPSYYY